MSSQRPSLVPPNATRRDSPVRPTHPFDSLHGTDTGGLIPGKELRLGGSADTFADRSLTAYYAVAPSILRSLLALWQQLCRPPLPLERYTFVDIGSGKGRAILLAAENPFRAVLGVERNPQLAGLARRNVKAARQSAASTGNQLLAPIRVIEADALTLAFPKSPTLLFLFHPFEASAMRRFLQSIATQMQADPRPLDLLYVNAEHAATLDTNLDFGRLWYGRVPMSTEDHLADLQEIAGQVEYGSTGDEICAIYRFTAQTGRRLQS